MSEPNILNELLRRILFLPRQASSVAAEIDLLHYFVIGCTMLGATALTVVGVYFLVKYRARGHVLHREDPKAVPPVWAEALVISGLLALFCLMWSVGFIQFVRVQSVPEESIDVYVTGKQWMWKFAYPDGTSTIANLFVPANQPVRLIMTSRDVIHSFYVPEFRLKHDVLPGRYTTMWFEAAQPGRYWIFCTEYCGTEHSTMRGQVVVLSPEDYARWLDSPQRGSDMTPPVLDPGVPLASTRITPTPSGPRPGPSLGVEAFAPAENLNLVHQGRQVAAQQGCLRCHTLDGTTFIGPTWAGLYQSVVPLADDDSVVADVAYITESMMDPLARIRQGFQPVMPSYPGRLSPAETGALVELIKSLATVAPWSRPEDQLELPVDYQAPLPVDSGKIPQTPASFRRPQ